MRGIAGAQPCSMHQDTSFYLNKINANSTLSYQKVFLTLKHHGCEQQPDRDMRGGWNFSLHF